MSIKRDDHLRFVGEAAQRRAELEEQIVILRKVQAYHQRALGDEADPSMTTADYTCHDCRRAAFLISRAGGPGRCSRCHDTWSQSEGAK